MISFLENCLSMGTWNHPAECTVHKIKDLFILGKGIRHVFKSHRVTTWSMCHEDISGCIGSRSVSFPVLSLLENIDQMT
jgi:hypothetical protein